MQVLAGVPQGSILGPLLKSNAKLFADDTSLFTIVKDNKESANILKLGIPMENAF